jgi:DNA-binding MarR family transcriptional regulator
MKEESSAPSVHSRRSGRRQSIEEVVRHLHHIFKVVDTFSRRTLAEFGVSGPQIWALRTIEAAGSLTMGELAEALFLHMSTVTGIVDRLEGRRLVLRERFGEDRRVVHLRVTARGRSVIDRTPEPPRSLIAKGLQDLQPRELGRMRYAVARLAQIMRADRLEPETSD